MLDYGAEICADLGIASQREWLVTNGLGGYATGTISGVLTRAYHGLLIAAQSPPENPGLPPAARTLLLVKLDETATYDGRRYALYANRYVETPREDAPEIVVTPHGYRHLQRFHLEGATPVWTYGVADALLEKRVWMQQGANTTYIHYRLARATRPLTLDLQALVTCRDHHGNVADGSGWQMAIEPVPHGLRIATYGAYPPFYLLSDHAAATPQHTWRPGFYLAVENYRGLLDVETHLHAADLSAVLRSGESLTVVASTAANASLDGAAAYAARQAYERTLLPTSGKMLDVAHLFLAADQFIVARALARSQTGQRADGSPGRSVIAGYPWFGDWGRDTMISLPGLTLATGRPEVARQILLTFAQVVDRGMLPNRFPDAGETPEYNTVDATLWYFEAVRAYYAATSDGPLLRDLYPILQDIVAWHQRGTRYNIHIDPTDGLLYAGEEGVQLTWMDAKAGDWVVTPRIGKPVEINALWYNALRAMAGFARLLGLPADSGAYDALADRVQASFSRFWNAQLGYCYDVIDGPAGDDPSLRPNQLFAVSLPHSPLNQEQARGVVDACARQLLTPHGLRSLAPDDPAYIGRYGGDRLTRDAAYHQGVVWGWLIGPFVSAHLRVYCDADLARSFLQPMLRHLNSHCVGSLSEIFDGDPPHTPRGCIAQAWTVAEVLRVWQQLAEA